MVQQYMRNLEEFGLELPWFWSTFLDELDDAHHSLQLALYSTRTLLWFDEPSPSEPDRAWLRAKYPTWEATYAPIWDQIEHEWAQHGEAASLAYALPGICNLCQLPTVFASPKRDTVCTFNPRWTSLSVLFRTVPMDLRAANRTLRGAHDRGRPCGRRRGSE